MAESDLSRPYELIAIARAEKHKIPNCRRVTEDVELSGARGSYNLRAIRPALARIPAYEA